MNTVHNLYLMLLVSISSLAFGMEQPGESNEAQAQASAKLTDKLPLELWDYIRQMLMPSAYTTAGEIIERLEDIDALLSSSKEYQALENATIGEIKKNSKVYSLITTYSGENLLELAISEKKGRVAYLLFKAGFNTIDLCAKYRNHFFAWAICNGHVDIAEEIYQKLLMKDKSEANKLLAMKSESHESLLGIVCSKGQLPSVSWLFEKGFSDVQAMGQYNITPLLVSCASGNVAIAQKLLDHGALIDFESAFHPLSSCPLAMAAFLGKRNMVEFLLSKNAKVTTGSLTPLARAQIGSDQSTKHDEIISMLFSHGAEERALDQLEKNEGLLLACSKDLKESVKVLLSQGASLDCRDKFGRTPLLVAAFSGRIGVVEYLLSLGADVMAKSNKGHDALEYALIDGNEKMLQVLLKYGVDINRNNHWLQTPLTRVLGFNKVKIEFITFLLDAKAEVNLPDAKCMLPLVRCIKAKKLEERIKRVKLLIAYGADVNKRDNNQLTPLMHSVIRGRSTLANLLIKHGANIHAVDSKNRTALDIAKEQDNKEIIEILTEAKHRRARKQKS